MLSCDACQTLLADSLYEPLKARDQQALDAHVESCPACQALAREMHDSISRLQAMDMPQEAAPDMDVLWTSLEPHLDREDAQRYRQLSHGETNSHPIMARHVRRPQGKANWRGWAGGTFALAASLVMAVTVVFQATRNEPVESAPTNLVSEVNTEEFHRYLDRAQAVMLLLANAEQYRSGGMPLDRDYASLMAVEARLLNASLGGALTASQQKLLSDLEFLLLQFANIDDDSLADGLAMLQLYLQDNTVLFRMNLARMKQQPQVI